MIEQSDNYPVACKAYTEHFPLEIFLSQYSIVRKILQDRQEILQKSSHKYFANKGCLPEVEAPPKIHQETLAIYNIECVEKGV